MLLTRSAGVSPVSGYLAACAGKLRRPALKFLAGTDGGGRYDGDEVAQGTNPLDPEDDFLDEFEPGDGGDEPGVGSRDLDREWETVVADGGCACTTGGPLEGGLAALFLATVAGMRRKQQ